MKEENATGQVLNRYKKINIGKSRIEINERKGIGETSQICKGLYNK